MLWVSSSVRRTHGHYHYDPDCYRLRGGIARNKTSVIVSISELDAARLRPCAACAEPRPDFFKPFCAICDTWRACPHNGGVPVRTRRGVTYVWPDQAILHEPLVRDEVEG